MQFLAAYRQKAFSFVQRWLAKVVEVHPQEVAALLSGFAYFFCLLSSYYLIRPLRDAMGLTGGVGNLQWLFTATFISMLVLVPVFGALAARWPPRRFVPFIYRFFAFNILGFGALFATGAQEVAVSRVFFVWISVFNLFVVSIFWSVLADHFTNEQGRRLFGFIAAGGTAGALVGPGLAALLSAQFGVVILTVLSAILLELAVQCFRSLARAKQRQTLSSPDSLPSGTAAPSRASYDAQIGGSIFAGISLIMRDHYLLGIVLYALLHTFVATFLYFEQARIVAALLTNTASRTQLFAIADLATSCLTIVLQLFITGRFLRRIGIAAALMLLPLAGLAAIVGLAFWPSLVVLVVLQSVRRAVDYAIARPGREVLFTVVSREAKYKAKSVIETVVYRGGDAASGWLVAGLTAFGIGFAGIAMLSVPLTAGWVGLAVWLARSQEKRTQLESQSWLTERRESAA